MKKKLFLLLCALLTSVGMWADVQTDYTSSVNNAQAGWTGATGTYGNAKATDGTTLNIAERYYGDNSVSGADVSIFKQTVSGLPNGTYMVVFYATANNARCPEANGGIQADASDLVYVYAGSDKSHKAYVNSHKAASYTYPGEYIVSGAVVTDGTLELGMYAEKTGTQWQTIQVKALLRTDAVSEDGVDMTAAIVNAKVSNGEGWTGVRTNSGEQYTGAPDNTYMDAWDGSAKNFDMKQTLKSLPAGYYTLKVATRASTNLSTGNIYAYNESNFASTTIHKDGNTGGDLDRGWSWTEVRFNLHETTDVTLGFYCSVNNNWAGADDWHLTYQPVNVETNKNLYLRNVATGRYLTYGNNYTTRASLDGSGFIVKFGAAHGYYTILGTAPKTDKYVGCNGYVDRPVAESTWNIIPVSEGKYALRATATAANNPGKYLVWEGTNANSVDLSTTTLSETLTENGYWEIVYPETRQDLSGASKSNPIDVTYLISNPDFEADKTGWTPTFDINSSFNNSSYFGRFMEKWVASPSHLGDFTTSQTIEHLTGGKYKLTVSALATLQGSETPSDVTGVTLSLNETEQSVGTSGTPQTYNLSAAVAEDGSLTIGFKTVSTTANWAGWDNLRLFYIGTCLINDAIDLPANGAMAAGTWYKFTPAAGNYNLTAPTLGDIVYTTDGSILTEDGSDVTATFGANPVTLSATTYYIKSSSANNFAYEADSYDVTALVTAYNTAVTEAGTAKTNAEAADKVNAAEKTALDNAITTYGSVEIPGDPEHATRTQKDALETATAALTDATSAVNTSITAYTNAKAYFDAVEPVLATTNFYTSAAYTANYPKAAYDAGTLSDDNAAALSYGERRDGNMPAILLSSWAGTTLYMNTWSTEAEGVAPAADFANPFFEYWVAGGNNLGANTFTSTIDGFEANTLYAVTLNARVKQRDGNRKVANSIKMKVGEEGDEVDLTQGLHIGMSRRFIDSYTAYGYTNASGELVTTITVAANSNISWLAFRDVNYARVEGASALDEVISEVTDLNGHVPTNVYNTAYTQVTAHTGVNYPTTDAEFATAISDIRSAVATAATYLDEYAGYLELKNYADALVAVTNDNPTANSTLATAISTAATDANSVANVAALTSVNTTLKDAMVTYAGAANPVGEGNKFDLTFMLGKVNFDDCISWESPAVNGFSGWATEQGDGNFQVMENASKTSGDYHSFMEYWSWNAKANDEFNLYTTVESLPVGTYTMSCYAFAVQQDGEAGKTPVPGLYFYANDTQGGVVNDNRLTQKSISFVNDNVQDVKIGLKPVSTGNTYNWMGIGYVELYKVPEQVYELNEATAWDHTQSGAGNVEITRTIKVGVNTVVFPFSMNPTEVEDYFGAGSVVYQLSSYEDETIHFITRSGISANEPCLVKATSTTNSAVAYTLNDRTVVAAASASPSVAGTNVTMTGTYAASTSVDQGNYIVSGSNIYLVNSDNVKMKNTRAYITLGTPNPGARLAIIFDEEDPTAINTIEAAESEAGALKDGKYLIEGKIVIVKNGVKYDANGKKLN